ncbi:pilus assembly protein TadG-related protein [Oscillatoria laete-virens NRMC-F 0139]|nr:pilus assembly protein TadG-related protein [Oscillatoria laete-virens]MDL5055282.1 pilus assembly protein TadG-related protein [Oscillatoria laete-virens NRMC-F 0139]
MTSASTSYRRRQRWVKAQSGQSLVILAIGFVALLGFVGIVTDVSLLFVRYSTLRRAVDAAAVASAGQFRRVFDETDNAIAEGEAESVANLNFAARQFIEFYGLNPSQVLVETCRAQGIEQREVPAGSGSFRPYDAAGNELYLYDTNGVKTGDNPAADAATRARYEQLCTRDELKLVRVTAQIESPTVFLRLLGYPTITLTESAISQTAVIDVVMIIDVSESMLNQTTYAQWETIDQGVRYLPRVIPQSDPAWTTLLNSTQNTLDSLYPPYAIVPATGPASDDTQPRAECRVRAYPYSVYGGLRPYTDLRNDYQTFLTSIGSSLDTYFAGAGGSSSPWFSGFVPQYNFYGCCNDPDGNWRFDDNICQPFRSARDAAESFLERLDFLRGDRIAYVTFDRRAYIVDPDGAGIQSPMIETERNLVTGSAATSRRGAWETLRDVIGVRAEPSFYTDGDPTTDADNDGYWDGFRNAGGRVTWTDLNNTPIGNLLDNPVAGNCPFQMAFMDLFYSTATVSPFGGPRTTTLLEDISTVPNWFLSTLPPAQQPANRKTKSYEFHASCAGTNIGGGLQAGSAALYQSAGAKALCGSWSCSATVRRARVT